MTEPASRPYLSAPNRPTLPALTGLRAVAALWVVSWHSAGMLPGPPFPFSRGYLGVDLFFVLSGFVISYVYWHEFEQAGRRVLARLWLRFMALRIARMWPAHMTMVIVILAAAALAVPLAGRPFPAEILLSELPLHLLLIHNWGPIADTRINYPSWSVSAEFFVYALFPAYVALFRRLRSTAALLAAIALAMGLCWLAMTALLGEPLGTSGRIGQIRAVCEFAVGVALFRLWQANALARLPWDAIILGAAAAIAAIVLLTAINSVFDYLLVLLLAPLILGLAHGAQGATRLLSWGPLVWLGEISYSIYLAHALVVQTALWWLRRLDLVASQPGPEGWWLLLLSLAGSVLAGAALFVLVERPARFWLRARFDRLPAIAALPGAAGRG